MPTEKTIEQDCRRDRAVLLGWLLALTVLSATWIVAAGTRLSATFDEPTYLVAGLERWRTGSYDRLMKYGTMPLAVDLATGPLYLIERWRVEPFDLPGDIPAILAGARASNLVFWFLLLSGGGALAAWLGGRWAGALAIAMLAVEPTFLAHAALATTDIAVTAMVVWSLVAFLDGRTRSWPRRLALPGAIYGLTILAKASGLVFAPLAMAVAEVDRLARMGHFSRHQDEPFAAWFTRLWRDTRSSRRDGVAILLIGLATTFLYIGSDWRAEPSFVKWANSLAANPLGDAARWLAERLTIFTNAGEGLAQQIKHNMRGHGTFLLGQAYPRAIWIYFPIVCLVKLSAGFLLLLLGVVVLRRGNAAMWAAMAMLLFSLTSRVQIGVRLYLPMVALAMVGVAAAWGLALSQARRPWRRFALAATPAFAIFAAAVASAANWPDGLRFVNAFAGGVEKGFRVVSDSNYDWGQGLLELESLAKGAKIESLDVWYFGADPRVNRAPLRNVPLHGLPATEDIARALDGRVIAASTTLLHSNRTHEGVARAADYLLRQTPVARTRTYLVYDFRRPAEMAANPLPGTTR